MGKISGCLINSTVSLGDYKLSAASVLGVNQIDETIQDEGSYMR